jgi:hypothetical protein
MMASSEYAPLGGRTAVDRVCSDELISMSLATMRPDSMPKVMVVIASVFAGSLCGQPLSRKITTWGAAPGLNPHGPASHGSYPALVGPRFLKASQGCPAGSPAQVTAAHLAKDRSTMGVASANEICELASCSI